MKYGYGLGLGFIRKRGGEPPAAVPVNTVLPSISGTPMVGETLTVSGGSWTNGPILSRTYRWYDDGVIIGGATNNTYVLQAAQENGDITADVIATNAVGPSASAALSAAVGPVLAVGGLEAPEISDGPTPGYSPLIVNILLGATTYEGYVLRVQVASDSGFTSILQDIAYDILGGDIDEGSVDIR